MTPEQAVVAAIHVCLVGAVLVFVLGRWKAAAGWLSLLVTSASAVLVGWAVFSVLVDGPSAHPAPFWPMKLGFALRLYVDGLSAVFLALAAFVAVPVSLYAIGYMRQLGDRSAAGFYPHLLVFIAAMYGLVTTTDTMWFFFVFWQMMAIPGYALIRFERAENLSAARRYLLLMQVACVITMVGGGLLVGASPAVADPAAASLKYDFDTISANMPALLAASPGLTVVAFALFLVGFGIKSGMWPFGQLWVPDAYAAAPSPVSALLSGVMSKSGVYGIIRYFLWLVPPSAQLDYPMARWGWAVALLGTITLFTGTMQALRQEDAKRLLAFHSIGQIGYILLGTGACLALLGSGQHDLAPLATVGLFGALFHSVNHGLFKSLLFLDAGSMALATGTRDLDKLGGLARYMPWTALTTLVASFSIAGVPLLNGFVSKWSIYVAAVQGRPAAAYLPVCAVVAILTSALTLASFIKFFGVSFLSRTSAVVSAQALKRGRLEVGWTMQVPQLLLSASCVLLGVVPAIAFRIMQRALDASPQGFGTELADAGPIASSPWTGLEQLHGTALFAPLALAVVIGLAFLVAWLASRLGGATRRSAAPWLCGYVKEADCYRYSAHHFYGEIKRHFRWLGGATHARPTRPEEH
jgi:formate hydrogenlyase subunit 3/multisubunit Na+/H+ antiporter MnhD subunit